MSIEFKPNKETEKKLLGLPDRILYKCARITLDFTNPHIPMSRRKKTSGQLRRSTMIYGVRGGNGDYTIGSVTSYAKYVYNMNNSTTNWTTKDTYSHWFHETFKKKQQLIIKNAIDQAWKEK